MLFSTSFFAAISLDVMEMTRSTYEWNSLVRVLGEGIKINNDNKKNIDDGGASSFNCCLAVWRGKVVMTHPQDGFCMLILYSVFPMLQDSRQDEKPVELRKDSTSRFSYSFLP